MVAFLLVLVKVLPWITSLLTLIGSVNAFNAGQAVVTYGASPSTASMAMTIIPLLLAGCSKLCTMIGKSQLDALLHTAGKLSGLSDQQQGYAFDVIDVGRIAVYAKLYSEAVTDDERSKIAASADVAFAELRARLFPAKKGA